MSNKRRVKISTIFIVTIIILAAISIYLLVGSSRIESTVTEMQATTDEYIDGQDAITQMREVSDYLTEKCQYFIITGNAQYALDYFKEIHVDQRREASLKKVETYGEDEVIYSSLANALDESNSLAERECYAMSLACEGYNISKASISDDLVNVKLSKEDKALSPQDKVQKASNMVFYDSYIEQKNAIWEDVYISLDSLMEKTRASEVESFNKARQLVLAQNILLIIMLVLAIVLVLFTVRMVLSPLLASTGYIKDNKALPVKGAAEYAYLANAYNRMLEATQKHHEMLSYEATHDEMTSLYNRKFFDMQREELTGEEHALIIVDVDYFKSINDNYGHDVGDKVLTKVAGILAASFRSEDFVCRIGGDEFAVLMVQMNPQLKFVIEGKLAHVNEVLKNSDDDLPPVSLSIGIAFSDPAGSSEAQEPPAQSADAIKISDNLFNRADKALYKAKQDGRDRYAFYEEDVN